MCCWFKEIVSYTPKHRNCNRNFRIIKSAVGCEASTLAKSAPENNLGIYVLLAASPIGYSFPLDGLSIWAAQLKDSHRSLAVFSFFKVTGLTSAADSTKYAQKHKIELFTPRTPLYSLSPAAALCWLFSTMKHHHSEVIDAVTRILTNCTYNFRYPHHPAYRNFS